jgi:hypothetical protein
MLLLLMMMMMMMRSIGAVEEIGKLGIPLAVSVP